jgi:hypothetical protein
LFQDYRPLVKAVAVREPNGGINKATVKQEGPFFTAFVWDMLGRLDM